MPTRSLPHMARLRPPPTSNEWLLFGTTLAALAHWSAGPLTGAVRSFECPACLSRSVVPSPHVEIKQRLRRPPKRQPAPGTTPRRVEHSAGRQPLLAAGGPPECDAVQLVSGRNRQLPDHPYLG